MKFRKPKTQLLIAILLLSMPIGIFNIHPVLASSTQTDTDLNSFIFEKWEEWDSLLTYWFNDNGTLTDPYDYSRKTADPPEPSNITLSGIGGYVLALANMYEQTSKPSYLTKLRNIIDAMIESSWFYRDTDVGEIFYVPQYWFDDVENDQTPMLTVWVAYTSLKLYLWTGVSSYRTLATRVATESLDKLTAVNNATDLAWSWGYYHERTEANAKLGVNRQAPLVAFYILYGEYINSTFSNQIPRMLNWQFKAQLDNGAFAYNIGGETEAPLYTGLQTCEYFKEYGTNSSVFSEYVTELQNATDWMINYEIMLSYMESYGILASLISAKKLGFSVDTTTIQTMIYTTLRALGYTKQGVQTFMTSWTFGWRWPQFSLGQFFGAYPLSSAWSTWSGVPYTLIDYDVDKLLSYEFQTAYKNLFYKFRVDTGFGVGVQVYYPGIPQFFYLWWGRNQGAPSSTITNGSYYLNVKHDWGSGNVVNQYYYGTDLIIDDVSGSREFYIFAEDAEPALDIMVRNGTSYEMDSLFNSTVTLDRYFLVLQRAERYTVTYIDCPSTSWTFANGTGYGYMNTTVTNQRVLSASNLGPYIGEDPVIEKLESWKRKYSDVIFWITPMPLSIFKMMLHWSAVKEYWGIKKWGFPYWKPANINVEITDMEATNYVFEGSIHTFKATYWSGGSYEEYGYQELDTMRIKWNDESGTVVQAYYKLTTGVMALESGSAIVTLSKGEVTNVSSTTLAVEFKMFISNKILDSQNLDIYLWCNNTIGAIDTWDLKKNRYFNIYNLGGQSQLETFGDAGRVVGGDVFELYAKNNSWARASVEFRKLQHVKLLARFATAGGAPRGSWVFNFMFSYCTNVDGWREGLKLYIVKNLIYVTNDEANANFTATWYMDGVSLKTENWYGYPHTPGDYNGTVGFWLDFWFNKVNASSIVGGRINAYEYTMKDNNPWYIKLFGSAWGMDQDKRTQSMAFQPMTNLDGSTLHTQEITMVRITVEVQSLIGTSMHTELREIDTFDLTFAGEIFTGMVTPTFEETLVPTIPARGLMGTIYSGLMLLFGALNEAFGPAVLAFWDVLVGFLDTIFAWIGYPGAFSQMVALLTNAWNWFVTSISYVAIMIIQTFLLLSGNMGKFLSLLTTVVTQWISMSEWFWYTLDTGWGMSTGVWETLNISQWVVIAAILYPFWILCMWEEEGLNAVFIHITFVVNVFLWFVNGFLTLINFFMNLLFSIIEAIPLAE